MQKILLDSCVWINYLWQTQYSEKPKRKSPSTKLIEELEDNEDYQVILSPFLIGEISSHFRDYYIFQKIIKDGFSFREFSREKKNYSLSPEELDKIDQMIVKIGGFDFVNVLDLKGIDKTSLSEILNLETSYYFDFYDAIHFQTAKEEECKYLVTTDAPLRKCADVHNKENDLKINCIKPQALLKIIREST